MLTVEDYNGRKVGESELQHGGSDESSTPSGSKRNDSLSTVITVKENIFSLPQSMCSLLGESRRTLKVDSEPNPKAVVNVIGWQPTS